MYSTLNTRECHRGGSKGAPASVHHARHVMSSATAVCRTATPVCTAGRAGTTSASACVCRCRQALSQGGMVRRQGSRKALHAGQAGQRGARVLYSVLVDVDPHQVRAAACGLEMQMAGRSGLVET